MTDISQEIRERMRRIKLLILDCDGVLTDGRMVQLTSKSAILVNGMPSTPEQLRPGMSVMISAVNPVVYRNGRYVLFNQGFSDVPSGSPETWDSKFEGYEADTADAAMQNQSP